MQSWLSELLVLLRIQLFVWMYGGFLFLFFTNLWANWLLCTKVESISPTNGTFKWKGCYLCYFLPFSRGTGRHPVNPKSTFVEESCTFGAQCWKQWERCCRGLLSLLSLWLLCTLRWLFLSSLVNQTTQTVVWHGVVLREKQTRFWAMSSDCFIQQIFFYFLFLFFCLNVQHCMNCNLT